MGLICASHLKRSNTAILIFLQKCHENRKNAGNCHRLHDLPRGILYPSRSTQWADIHSIPSCLGLLFSHFCLHLWNFNDQMLSACFSHILFSSLAGSCQLSLCSDYQHLYFMHWLILLGALLQFVERRFPIYPRCFVRLKVDYTYDICTALTQNRLRCRGLLWDRLKKVGSQCVNVN